MKTNVPRSNATKDKSVTESNGTSIQDDQHFQYDHGFNLFGPEIQPEHCVWLYPRLHHQLARARCLKDLLYYLCFTRCGAWKLERAAWHLLVLCKRHAALTVLACFNPLGFLAARALCLGLCDSRVQILLAIVLLQTMALDIHMPSA